MKVNIGDYTSWFGPYQLAETLTFWVKSQRDEYGMPTKPDWVHDFGEWLAHGSVEPDPEIGEVTPFCRDRPITLLYKFMLWLDKFKKRKTMVKIERWDTYSADHTIALILVPLLKELKQTKHGSPYVKDEDVPDHLKSTNAPPKVNDYDVDDNHHMRWEYVLDEMIWAFEQQLNDDRETQFSSGDIDYSIKRLDNGMGEMIRNPGDTYKVDSDAQAKYEERIQNGLNMFAKYYSGLWS